MLKLTIFLTIVACSVNGINTFVIGTGGINPMEMLGMTGGSGGGLFNNFQWPVLPILTKDDILNMKPTGEGQTVNGKFMSSHMSSKTVNGVPESTYEATVIKNDNGNVTEYNINS